MSRGVTNGEATGGSGEWLRRDGRRMGGVEVRAGQGRLGVLYGWIGGRTARRSQAHFEDEQAENSTFAPKAAVLHLQALIAAAGGGPGPTRKAPSRCFAEPNMGKGTMGTPWDRPRDNQRRPRRTVRERPPGSIRGYCSHGENTYHCKSRSGSPVLENQKGCVYVMDDCPRLMSPKINYSIA